MGKAALILALVILTLATGCTKARPAAQAPEPSWQATTAPSGAPISPQAVEPTPSAAAQYTAADVASHATPADCWVSIAGKAYNVTEWISRHPGGSQAIIRSCGKDITAYGNSHPGGQYTSDRLQQILTEFYVGTLRS